MADADANGPMEAHGSDRHLCHHTVPVAKAFLYWFVMAAAAALTGGGRVSVRLLGDTAIMLAPIALIQLGSLAAVYWTGRRPLGFTSAADTFFAGSWPWIVAFAALAAFSVAVDPTVAWRWHSAVGMVLFAVAAAWTIPIDYRYYRHRLGRTAVRATTDLVVHRAIAWGATVIYLFRTALPRVGSTLTEHTAFLMPWR